MNQIEQNLRDIVSSHINNLRTRIKEVDSLSVEHLVEMGRSEDEKEMIRQACERIKNVCSSKGENQGHMLLLDLIASLSIISTHDSNDIPENYRTDIVSILVEAVSRITVDEIKDILK